MNDDFKEATVRQLRRVVTLLSRRGLGFNQRSRMRRTLCTLIGNLKETLERREGAQLLQCHVLLKDQERRWRIKLFLVPQRGRVPDATRIRARVECFPPHG